MNKSNENKNKTEKKPGLSELIATKTSLPSDILQGEFCLEIRGENTVMIQGCRRILKYSPGQMIVSTKKFDVTVRGERLICSTYHDGAICINGYIRGVDLGVGESEDKE